LLKIRTDFVTNSSSSSYIIALDKDIESLTKKDLSKMIYPKFRKYAGEIAERIKQDAYEMTRQDLVEYVDNSIYYKIVDRFDSKHKVFSQSDKNYDKVKELSTKYASELVNARVKQTQKIYETIDFPDCGDDLDRALDADIVFKKSENIFHISQH